jgi:hypothetical protein
LTRSRAAWLAAASAIVVFHLATMFTRPGMRTFGRLAGVVALAAAGVALALFLPNTLRWRSDNPYLESVKDVANYEEGSGRGRLVQYERSLLMAAHHPLLGVGPGNWTVKYPEHATRNDPSIDESRPGTTFNPWPSSDWVAFASERGPAAAIVIALAFIAIGWSGLRRVIAARGPEEGPLAAALLATLAAVLVAGLFDAVLLLALPALLVWAALGALWIPAVAGPRTIPLPVVLAMLAVSILGAARSTAQLVAMEILATTSDRASLERASRIDPGSYRLHLRLARGGRRDDRCRHARAAHSLFPSAGAARDLSRGCGGE